MTDHVRSLHPALRPYVAGWHSYDQQLPTGGIHRGLPGTGLTLVLPLDDPLDVGWSGDEESRDRFWSCVAGLGTRPAEIRHTGWQRGIQLELTPAGARMLLGMPAAGMADTMVDLDAIVGAPAGELVEQLHEAPDAEGRTRLVEEFLLGRLEGARTAVRSDLTHLLDVIDRRRGQVRVGDLAARSGWSRRHLVTLFRTEVGVSPKEYARLARFQASASCLRSPRRTPVEIALACGFADQAHLTREWRLLAGCTPAQWRREELPFLQDSAAGVEAH